MPAETVRRHVHLLIRSGACLLEGGVVMLRPAVLRSRRVTAFLRKIYVDAVRLLVDLTRIEVAAFASASRRPVQSGSASRLLGGRCDEGARLYGDLDGERQARDQRRTGGGQGRAGIRA